MSIANPLININEDAATTLWYATRAVRAILDARARLDRQGRRDTPVIVLAGETHPMPAFTAMQTIMLDSLAAREDVLFCMETEHTHLQTVFGQLTSAGPKRARSMIAGMDKNGAWSLKAKMIMPGSWHMNHALRLQYAMMIDRKIPALFNDCSAYEGKDVYLNILDTTTSAAIAASNIKGRTLVHFATPQGIRARNHHMFEMAQTRIASAPPRILIQQCGQAHVAGAPDHNILLRGSLAALWAKTGYPVITLRSERPVPSKSLKGVEQMQMPFMPRAMIETSVWKPHRFSNPPVLATAEEEEAYSNSLLKGAGLIRHTMSGNEMKARIDDYGRESKAAFNAIRRKFYKPVRPIYE